MFAVFLFFFFVENNYTLHVALYKALDKNDWESAKSYLEDHPNAVSARITSTGETALHIAANFGRVHLVKKLLELMPKEALEIRSHANFTALSLTAIEGSTKIAKLMVEKNSNILRIQNRHHQIPLVVSAINGNEDLIASLQQDVIFILMHDNTFIDVALDVLQRFSSLATAPDADGMSIINVLARKPSAFPSGNRHGFLQQFIYTFREIGRVWKALTRLVPGVKEMYEKKVIHVQVLELLKVICPQISNLNVQQLANAGAYNAIFLTASFGIIEFFKELLNSSPHLIYSINSDKQGIGLFQEAVLARQHNIYNFISQLGIKNDRAGILTTHSRNNMLHLAGFMAPPSQLERVSGAALQMQREIQWFL
ncbi:hypothetical protein MKW94_006707, partial [Papaver nudicaule]|nr:hypothetical protein [Papaver nudicaule]